MTDAFLNKQRIIGDAPADELVNGLFNSNSQAELYAAVQLTESELLKSRKASPVIEFLKSRMPQPQWFDAKRIVKGQQVFESYATEIMTLLGVLALPYCYAASPGNKALFLSTKMRKQPHKRLADTADFIISVSTKGNLTASKTGHIHINKTRLTHAIARYHVAKSGWDKSWGVPINQEDMAGTNLAFSYLILVGLNQSGFVLADQQKEDLLFLWRYIGYQLGIDEKLLVSSFKEAHQLAYKIKKRNFKKTEEGIVLTSELLSYYRSAIPGSASQFIDSQVRYYLGSEISAYLGLKPDFLKDKITSTMSTFKGAQNFLGIHKDSFGMMISNHRLLKKKLSM
ncbi:oxygenase MpaB family protein [soil metagenome]